MIKNLAIGGKPGRLPLTLGLVLGLLSAVLIVVYLSQVGGGDGGGGSDLTVAGVVANQDIPIGTKITADMVTLKQLPASAVIPDVFKTTDIVVGKVTTVAVTAGEQILPAKLTSTGVELTQFKGDLPVSVVIPEGRRGFSVLVSEVSAAGGLLRPGNYVDVISSQEVVSTTDSSKTVGTACYLAQDIEVLAVAQQVIGSRGAAAETAEGIAAAPADSAAASVTLAVTPQEAGTLAAAQRGVNGADVQEQVWLSVRPFGEHGVLADLPGCTQ